MFRSHETLGDVGASYVRPFKPYHAYAGEDGLFDRRKPLLQHWHRKTHGIFLPVSARNEPESLATLPPLLQGRLSRLEASRRPKIEPTAVDRRPLVVFLVVLISPSDADYQNTVARRLSRVHQSEGRSRILFG